jgi:hypothetical protein
MVSSQQVLMPELCMHLPTPTRATCRAHLILLNLINLILLGQK